MAFSSGPFYKDYSVAATIFKPFLRSNGQTVSEVVKRMAVRRVWYRTQKGHPRVPLPFESNLAFASGCSTDQLYARDIAFGPLSYVSKEVNLSYNKAYADFKEKAYDSAQWLVNAAERREAAVMIGNRAKQLLDLVNDLEHGRIPKGLKRAWRRFKRKSKGNKARSLTKGFADSFLEWHFGWGPMLQDITTSLEVLCKEYGGVVVHGKGLSRFETGRVREGTYGFTERVKGSVGHHIRAKVTVVNPNAFLLEQMGLVNVLSAGWELIPFSFLVDHVINIGQVLGSLTDFFGMTFDDVSATMFVEATSDIRFWDSGLVELRPFMYGNPPKLAFGEIYGKRYWNASGDAYFVQRNTGGGAIRKPSLTIDAKLPGLVRGLTYMSLLGSKLRDHIPK